MSAGRGPRLPTCVRTENVECGDVITPNVTKLIFLKFGLWTRHETDGESRNDAKLFFSNRVSALQLQPCFDIHFITANNNINNERTHFNRDRRNKGGVQFI